MNETVNAICAGKLNPDEDKDVLVVGSASSVLVYHVDNNSELFFKEVVYRSGRGKCGRMYVECPSNLNLSTISF